MTMKNFEGGRKMAGELKRILVVDDEEGVRNLLQRILKEAGYEVLTAVNGPEALLKISQVDFSIVLLDIKMPGMSGMEVLQQLTTDHPDICVVMVTALGDAQTAVEAMKVGAYDYITKPFNRDDLMMKVRKAIQKRNLLVENERHRLELEERVAGQAEHLRQQFAELVETLAREHELLYKLAEHQRGGIKSLLKRLPPELQEPMSSVEEFREALLRILRRGAKSDSGDSTDSSKASKR